MQVPLNDEREYLGGRVVYATNAGFVRPKRCLGSYTLHDDEVPHGVTALTRGVRYSGRTFSALEKINSAYSYCSSAILVIPLVEFCCSVRLLHEKEKRRARE